MTKQELLQMVEDRIAIDPEFATLVESRNDTAIAEALSEGRTRIESYIGGIGTILNVLGPEQGAIVLDTLNAIKETNRAVFWGWILLEAGELDFGLPSTRGMIDALVLAGAISPENGETIKAVAEVPEEIDVSAVSAALNGG